MRFRPLERRLDGEIGAMTSSMSRRMKVVLDVIKGYLLKRRASFKGEPGRREANA